MRNDTSDSSKPASETSTVYRHPQLRPPFVRLKSAIENLSFTYTDTSKKKSGTSRKKLMLILRGLLWSDLRRPDKLPDFVDQSLFALPGGIKLNR